jgi:3-isopropylmalate/(R)-2-methylmalate dehydratase small subunit
VIARKFTRLRAIAAPLVRPYIDTNALIPGHPLTCVAKVEFGRGLFAEWRFEDPEAGDVQRREHPHFVLNRTPYRQARILLAGVNFACGSSREAAVWALRDFGIRCVIAASYGPIFYANCFKNGLLPVVLSQDAVDAIARQVQATAGAGLVDVDLTSCTVTAPAGARYPFAVARAGRGCTRTSSAWRSSHEFPNPARGAGGAAPVATSRGPRRAIG